jgi:hypothetical protein
MSIMEGLFIAMLLFTSVVIVLHRYGRRPNVTFIEKPTLGLLDLSNGLSTSDLNADRETLGSLFYSARQSTSQAPKCDVLFMYCQIETDGHIRGSKLGLRELIRESGASVVIIASENSAEGYIAASKKTGYGYANLVMTHDRKGEVFGRYFYKLFSEMKQGTSMPLAWVKLAPQIRGAAHLDAPEVIFVCETGHIAFR